MTRIWPIFGSGGGANFGSGFQDDGTMTWSDAMGPDGEFLLDEDTGNAVTSSGGGSPKLVIAITETAGAAGNAWVDVWAFCTFTTFYSNDFYKIIASTPTSLTIDEPHTGPDDNITSIQVGGAAVADKDGWVGAVSLVGVGDEIHVGPGTHSYSNTVGVDGNSVVDGTEGSRIAVRAVDSNGTAIGIGDTRPIIQPDATIAGALIEIFNDVDYWDWYFLDFNGTNGAFTADYGIYCNDDASDYHRFFNCKFHDTDSWCFYTVGDINVLFDCEFYGAKADGGCRWAAGLSDIIGCSFHNNVGTGLSYQAPNSSVSYCNSYDNTGVGIDCQSNSDWSSIIHNTTYNNGTDGFKIASNGDDSRFYNNTSANNGGYGYNLNGDITHFAFFGHNHSHGNNKHSNDAGGDVISDADWAVLGQGSNTFADPQYVNPGGTPPNFAIGNPNVLQSGIPDPSGRATLIGADAIELTGPFNRLRPRYDPASHGYKL